MSRFTLVTEGVTDREILSAILPIQANDPNVRILIGGGWSGADSLARSCLIHNNTDVALVVDADTSDKHQVESRKRFLHESLGEIATRAQWKVFVIVPAIEGLLFKDHSVIEGLLGHPLSETDFVRGTFEPKVVLEENLPNKGLLDAYRKKLPSLDLSKIRAAAPIPELLAFLKSDDPAASAGIGTEAGVA